MCHRPISLNPPKSPFCKGGLSKEFALKVNLGTKMVARFGLARKKGNHK